MINFVQKTVTIASVILSTAAGFLEDGADRSRELQSLSERWDINEPTFAYDSLQFSLKWQVSDYIQDKHILYSVYDSHACKDGGANDITYSSNYLQEHYLYTTGIQASVSTPHNPDPVTSGSGSRDMYLHLSIQSNTISNSQIYTDRNIAGEVSGNVQFCIRFGLYNDSPELPNSLEVNFIETLIDFNAYLSDGFEIGVISVVPNDKTEATANDACEVFAYECDLENQPVEFPDVLRNQGTEFRVCVTLTDESKSIGLFLNRLTWFYFFRENPDGTVRQDAILDDSVVSPTGLTTYFCQPGDETCAFATILIAAFFDTQGIVQGIGEAVCQFGGNDVSPTSAPTQTASLAPTAMPLFEFDCENFAVHAGTAITFADNTITGGDVGISPGTSITGLVEIVDGAVASVGDAALFADTVYDAWVAAMVIRVDAMAFAVEMGGETFTPGTWRSGTITIVAGSTVFLDGQNDPNSMFLFQSDATLITGAGCKVILINGAKAENILWALGTAATFGADAVFEGSLLTGTAITFGALNVVHGCAIALSAITFGGGGSLTVVQAVDETLLPPSGPSCGSEVVVVNESDGDFPFPEGVITIDNQAADGTSVTFTMRQKWNLNEAISWMAIMYPNNPDGDNVCPVNTAVPYDDGMQYTANCFNEVSTPIRVFVQVGVDGSVGNPVVVPEDCSPGSLVEGRKVEYEISIPCRPCAAERALRSRNLLANSSRIISRDSPSFKKTLLSETALLRNTTTISNKNPLLYRAMQETPVDGPGRFELVFNVYPDNFEEDSAFFKTLMSVHTFLALSCFTLAFALFP